jgi:hypothetical protein
MAFKSAEAEIEDTISGPALVIRVPLDNLQMAINIGSDMNYIHGRWTITDLPVFASRTRRSVEPRGRGRHDADPPAVRSSRQRRLELRRAGYRRDRLPEVRERRLGDELATSLRRSSTNATACHNPLGLQSP